MKKVFSIYGNCQSGSIAHYLNGTKEFSNIFTFKRLIPVHVMSDIDIEKAKKVFQNTDLLIHQVISSKYKIPQLSTQELMKCRKDDSISITFPSLYFNGYFPHLGAFKGVRSILNMLHDYIILYCFAKGLNEKETLDIIMSEDLYPQSTSLELLDWSFRNLAHREKSLDIKVSDFIKNNYKNIKLFPHFQHPIDMVTIHIVNQILKILSLDPIEEPHSDKIFSSNVSTPIYRSTYKNLGLTFKEDFNTYQTTKGFIQQDEVLSEFFKTYKNLDKEMIISEIKREKKFIIEMFESLGI